MTVIAFDGKTLAADKMTNFGSMHAITTKVHRINSCLVAGCGTTALVQEMLEWFRCGCKPDDFPSQQRDFKESVSLLVVCEDGRLEQYETTPWPLKIHNQKWAIGSGRDFAMAAMYLGKTAIEAVEVACVLCYDCGNGVDVISHEKG